MEDESSISSEEEEYLTLVRASIIMGLLRRRRRRRGRCRRVRKVWVRSIYRRRCQQGDFHSLLQEMRLSDPESHFRYMRMSRERFDSLLQMVQCVLFSIATFLCSMKYCLGYSAVVSSRLFQSLKT